MSMYIVTGGTQGIGAATVEQLIGQGLSVVFTGRDVEAGERLVQRLPGSTFVAGDVRQEADCQRVVDRALELGNGSLQGLVNNAGMAGRKALTQTSQLEWDTMFEVNTRSAFSLSSMPCPACSRVMERW